MPNKLPSGWQKIYFNNEEYVKIIDGDRGVNYPKQKEFFSDGYCVFLNTKNVTKYGFNFDDIKYITREKDEKLRSGKLKRYDIVMTTRGTIGNIAFYDNKINFDNIRINSGMVIFRIFSDKVLNKYLYMFLSSNIIKEQISNYISGMAQPQLPISSIHKLYFILPPLDEQKRIADILSLCDDAIENLNTLIEKKELYKKGVMQKVLTGEVRFKGFKDEWQTVKLGDLATITSAGVDKKINSDEKEVRLLNYLDVFNRNKLYDNEISFITSANDTQIEKCNIKKGDLFITPSSEDREGIAKSAVAMEDFNNVVYSYHIIRLRFNKEVDLKFKSYMCDTELFHRQAYRLCDGSGQRYVISLGTFREMEIYIPKSIEEQKRIGELLSAIDDDIDNLKKLLELRKQQKKGLMQRLLTGEIRV